MCLNLTLQLADMVLSPAACPLEGVVNRIAGMGVALVVRWRSSHVHLSTIRKREVNIDLVSASALMMASRSPDHDATGRDATEPVVKRLMYHTLTSPFPTRLPVA